MDIRPKLIILESPDGLGKSTQASLLFNRFYPEAKLISQPSDDNVIGFIRSSVKDPNTNWTAMERQMLISLSHCVDAFTCFDSSTNIIMDRSYISGLVYGKLTNAPEDKMKTLINCLKAVYTYNIALKYDVYVIIFDAKNRFNKTSHDFFETQTKWENLRDFYLEIPKLGFFFSPDEKISIVNVEGKSVFDIHKEIIEVIEGKGEIK
jgi:thymidylate kinase